MTSERLEHRPARASAASWARERERPARLQQLETRSSAPSSFGQTSSATPAAGTSSPTMAMIQGRETRILLWIRRHSASNRDETRQSLWLIVEQPHSRGAMLLAHAGPFRHMHAVAFDDVSDLIEW